MGWLGNLVSKIVQTKARDFILTDNLGTGTPLVPDSYVSVRVVNMRLPFSRERVVERVYAIVHGFLTLQRFGEGQVKLAAATMPADLAGVSSDRLDKIISLNRLIAGPTPYVGGDINLQIGLFSVVQENLASTLLTTVTELSGAIGTGFAAAAAPYVGVLQTAMQMLSGASGHVTLEIGLDNSYAQPSTGTFALVAADRGKLNPAKFSLDATTNGLLYDGTPYLGEPYLVFAIECSSQRADWATIPELAAAYRALQAVMRALKTDAANKEEALAAFRLAALTSPDLVPADAQRIVQLVSERVAVVAGPVRGFGMVKSGGLPDFERLPMYTQ